MSRIEGGLYVTGGLSAGSFSLPAGAVSDAGVAAGAAIDASKVNHSQRANYVNGNIAATVVAETRVVHVVHGASGTIKAAKFGAEVAAIGDSTATIDVKKNGTTVLTGTVSLTSAQAARALVAGTISGGASSVVAGDVIEVVTTISAGAGTLAKGVFGYVEIWETPQ